MLLKGVPTLIGAGDTLLVSATGTPVLAAAGSGDVLAGIAGTLLAQRVAALEGGACAAWSHGRAAELAGRGRPVRGVTLEEVVAALSRAWASKARRPRVPLLHELPSVGEG